MLVHGVKQQETAWARDGAQGMLLHYLGNQNRWIPLAPLLDPNLPHLQGSLPPQPGLHPRCQLKSRKKWYN